MKSTNSKPDEQKKASPIEHTSFRDFRTRAREALKKCAAPSFKYGLNIQLRPSVDMDHYVSGGSVQTTNIPSTTVVSNENLTVFRGSEFPVEKVAGFFELVNESQSRSSVELFADAFANDITIIDIPKNFSSKKPIQLTYAVQDEGRVGQLVIVANEAVNASISVTISGQSKVFSKRIRVLAKSDSSIDLTIINMYRGVSFVSSDIVQERDSKVTMQSVFVGANNSFTHSRTTGTLIAQGAVFVHNALVVGALSAQQDVFTTTHHKSPHTTSSLSTRGVVRELGKIVARGLIRIDSGAVGCVANERLDVLALHSTAEADAIPELEIQESDVKCTHAATITRIDPEKLFYLESKGLPAEDAHQAIVEGFINAAKIPSIKINLEDQEAV